MMSSAAIYVTVTLGVLKFTDVSLGFGHCLSLSTDVESLLTSLLQWQDRKILKRKC